MTSVRLAASCAAVLSFVTIFACIIMVPTIINEVNSIKEELDFEMVEFAIMSKRIWSDIHSLGGSKSKRQAAPSYGARGAWGASSTYYAAPVQEDEPGLACNCNAQNTCPRGPAGPPGEDGEPGVNGLPGLEGQPGEDATHVLARRQQWGQCFTCPRGMDGGRGPPGPLGKRGQRGAMGKNGHDGLPGRPGCSGESGITGPPGNMGNGGDRGPPGNNTMFAVPLRGNKGPVGPPGYGGDKGAPGRDANDGPMGLIGDRGYVGSQGPTGPRGDRGLQGPIGQPGRDAHYCPCPPKGATRPPPTTTTTTEPPTKPPTDPPAAPPVYYTDAPAPAIPERIWEPAAPRRIQYEAPVPDSYATPAPAHLFNPVAAPSARVVPVEGEQPDQPVDSNLWQQTDGNWNVPAWSADSRDDETLLFKS